jgi:hypothetical protein
VIVLRRGTRVLTVPAGSRLILVGGRRRIPIRTLAPLEVRPGAVTPVVAGTEVLDVVGAHVGVNTEAGLVTSAAEVFQDDGHLMLRLGDDVRTHQRRQDMRGELALEVLIAVPDDEVPEGRQVVTGRTMDISGGGLKLSIEAAPASAEVAALRSPGAMVEAEIALPGGNHVSALLQVVDADDQTLRTSFVAIDRRDRERLIGLVINRRRQEQAGRPSSVQPA